MLLPCLRAWSASKGSIFRADWRTFGIVVTKSGLQVFYYASWCGGCTAIKPHYVAASEEAFEHADINCTFVAIDCEHNPNTCASVDTLSPSSAGIANLLDLTIPTHPYRSARHARFSGSGPIYLAVAQW